MTAPVGLPPRLVLYDGLCGFCDGTVQWLLRHDKGEALHYAPLQGATAAAIQERHPEIPAGLDSIILVEQTDSGERLSWHSAAAFAIARSLPAPWKMLAIFSFFPRFLTDLGYRAFARIRYSIWGRRESCRIPTPAERARFLS